MKDHECDYSGFGGEAHFFNSIFGFETITAEQFDNLNRNAFVRVGTTWMLFATGAMREVSPSGRLLFADIKPPHGQMMEPLQRWHNIKLYRQAMLDDAVKAFDDRKHQMTIGALHMLDQPEKHEAELKKLMVRVIDHRKLVKAAEKEIAKLNPQEQRRREVDASVDRSAEHFRDRIEKIRI